MKRKLQIFLLMLIGGLMTVGCFFGDDPYPEETTGGVAARFSIVGDYLYTFDAIDLKTIKISDPTSIEETAKNTYGGYITLLNPYNEYLLFGTSAYTDVISVENPDRPTKVFTLSFLTECDNVVFQGDYAYVTTRRTSNCLARGTQLEVINIANLQEPLVVTTVNLMRPEGVAIEGNQLFVAEGTVGLRQFDISNPTNPIQTRLVDTIEAFDLSINNGLLMVVGTNGLHQYEFNQEGDLNFLSTIQRAE